MKTEQKATKSDTIYIAKNIAMGIAFTAGMLVGITNVDVAVRKLMK